MNKFLNFIRDLPGEETLISRGAFRDVEVPENLPATYFPVPGGNLYVSPEGCLVDTAEGHFSTGGGLRVEEDPTAIFDRDRWLACSLETGQVVIFLAGLEPAQRLAIAGQAIYFGAGGYDYDACCWQGRIRIIETAVRDFTKRWADEWDEFKSDPHGATPEPAPEPTPRRHFADLPDGGESIINESLLMEDEMKKVVITRHAALVELLAERGVISGTEKVLSHATADDVRDKHVVGVLPLSLAALAASVTEIPLALTPEDRGKELTLDRLREIAGDAVTYAVTVV